MEVVEKVKHFINNTCDNIGGSIFMKLYGGQLQIGVSYFNNSVFENNKATID